MMERFDSFIQLFTQVAEAVSKGVPSPRHGYTTVTLTKPTVMSEAWKWLEIRWNRSYAMRYLHV